MVTIFIKCDIVTYFTYDPVFNETVTILTEMTFFINWLKYNILTIFVICFSFASKLGIFIESCVNVPRKLSIFFFLPFYLIF